jgi:hypothetical protein
VGTEARRTESEKDEAWEQERKGCQRRREGMGRSKRK